MAAEGNRQGRKRVARLRIKPQARPSSTITPKNRRQRSRIASKRRNPGSRAATNILPRRLLGCLLVDPHIVDFHCEWKNTVVYRATQIAANGQVEYQKLRCRKRPLGAPHTLVGVSEVHGVVHAKLDLLRR